ncbi:MAG: hypothetical protein V3V08_01885 [Nannocystaceae bacterium]
MRTRTIPDSSRNHGVPILARSLFRQMRDQGYSTDQIIGFSSELIDLVRDDMRRDLEPAE